MLLVLCLSQAEFCDVPAAQGLLHCRLCPACPHPAVSLQLLSSALAQGFVLPVPSAVTASARPHRHDLTQQFSHFCLNLSCSCKTKVQEEGETHEETWYGLIPASPFHSSWILHINRLAQPFQSCCTPDTEPGVRALSLQAWPLHTAKTWVSAFRLYFTGWVSSMVCQLPWQSLSAVGTASVSSASLCIARIL